MEVFHTKRLKSEAAWPNLNWSRSLNNTTTSSRLEKKLPTPVRTGWGRTALYPLATGFMTPRSTASLNW